MADSLPGLLDLELLTIGRDTFVLDRSATPDFEQASSKQKTVVRVWDGTQPIRSMVTRGPKRIIKQSDSDDKPVFGTMTLPSLTGKF